MLKIQEKVEFSEKQKTIMIWGDTSTKKTGAEFK